MSTSGSFTDSQNSQTIAAEKENENNTFPNITTTHTDDAPQTHIADDSDYARFVEQPRKKKLSDGLIKGRFRSDPTLADTPDAENANLLMPFPGSSRHSRSTSLRNSDMHASDPNRLATYGGSENSLTSPKSRRQRTFSTRMQVDGRTLDKEFDDILNQRLRGSNVSLNSSHSRVRKQTGDIVSEDKRGANLIINNDEESSSEEDRQSLIIPDANKTRTKSEQQQHSDEEESEEDQWNYFVDKMRHVLRLHFITPWEKFRIRGLLPARAIVQLLSIFIFSAELIIYANYQEEFQLFLDENQESFRHLFLKDWDFDYTDPVQKVRYPYSVYRPDDIKDIIEFAVDSYANLDPQAIGNWTFCSIKDKTETNILPINMELCIVENKVIMEGSGNKSAAAYIDISQPITHCGYITIPDMGNDTYYFNFDEFTFDNFDQYILTERIEQLQSVYLRFYLLNQHLGALNVFFEPNCYIFYNELKIDNGYHTGLNPVSLQIKYETFDCRSHKNITVYYLENDGIEYSYVLVSGFLDIFSMFWSVLLILLTVKSIRRKYNLLQVVKKFWLVHKKHKLDISDQMEFVDFWNIIILFSCVTAIIGSLIKFLITTEVIRAGYCECSVCLGLTVMLSFIAVLQHFTYSKNFNTLMRTIKVAAPNLIRFLVCILCLWLGFVFFAWLTFGGYHYKFETFTSTMQTMFCLINGDDVFVTFSEMSRDSRLVFIVQQIWMFVFITLYICFILGLFLAIVLDTYQRVTHKKHTQPSEMEAFLNENNGHQKSTADLEKSTRLKWSKAFFKFFQCQKHEIDFDKMKITFEK